jgi:hypothetical protein
MPTTPEEIADFQRFAVEQLRNGGAGLSLEQLLDQWRAEHPTPEELRDSLAALERGLEDIRAGRVVSARTVIEQLKQGLPAVAEPDA